MFERCKSFLLNGGTFSKVGNQYNGECRNTTDYIGGLYFNNLNYGNGNVYNGVNYVTNSLAQASALGGDRKEKRSRSGGVQVYS
ncbi:hypothetical protein WG66_006715 [Moniliophthora roreri]|uniref:Uncharacterized protein n=1 Tax=Moniliophthora roreri TaxID=221103 RepID=A0A0W0GB32_MONRR|nr:hypothetical protein WG66_006715 [Moniliophthora roreri]